MSQAIVRFGELKVESFVQGSENNWLIYGPLPTLSSIQVVWMGML